MNLHLLQIFWRFWYGRENQICSTENRAKKKYVQGQFSKGHFLSLATKNAHRFDKCFKIVCEYLYCILCYYLVYDTFLFFFCWCTERQKDESSKRARVCFDSEISTFFSLYLSYKLPFNLIITLKRRGMRSQIFHLFRVSTENGDEKIEES